MPEHTTAALAAALSSGAESIEGDIWRTADGAYVMMHDPTLLRTTNAAIVFPGRDSYRVRDFTLAQIKQLDAGSWFGPAFAGLKVPTLQDWVRAIDGRARIDVEVKEPRSSKSTAQELAAILTTDVDVASAVATAQLTVASFDLVWLKQFAEEHPSFRAAALTAIRMAPAELQSVAAWGDAVTVRATALDESLVEDAHKAGLSIDIYTLNSIVEMRDILRLLPDGVITDFPGRLQEVLKPRRP